MTGSNPSPSTRQSLGLAALVVGATFLAYLRSLSGLFIWNDSDYVTAPALQSLAGLARIWTEPGATQQYYPLLHTAFWVQHRIFGDHPLGYHLVTVGLHAGAAVLFALTLRKLTVPGAWLAAILFALHPVHVESVAWITEQKNTLSLVFYLGAALLYLDFDAHRRPSAYGTALVLFILSLLCKTVTAPLPAVLLVILWWKRGRLSGRADVRPLLPWLALGAAAGAFSSWVERGFGGADGVDFSLSFAGRILVAGRAIWFYLAQLVWPFHLNFIYPRWAVDPSAGAQWLFPLGVLAVLAAGWWVRGRTRTPLAVALIFAGSLFPVLGFVNLYGSLYSWVWDHWQYLADLAPLALVAALLSQGLAKAATPWLEPVAVGAIMLFLGLLTWAHSAMFHDDQALYRATLARNPGAWMAHYNLALVLEGVPGGLPEAAAEFEAALAVKPDHAKAHNNLGILLARTPGGLPAAIGQFEAALRLAPNDALPRSNLGLALARTPGRAAEGVALCEAAVRLDPRSAEAHNNLGNVLAPYPERRPQRLAEYQAALRINPGLVEAHYNLGYALAEDPAQAAEAAMEFEAVLQVRPRDGEAHLALGLALAELPGRRDEAGAQLQEAERFGSADPRIGPTLARLGFTQ